jgi:hypothetical protein
VALSVNFVVALAVWPGFMSWDSVFALKQLRSGITASGFPPMVSYMWALPDLLIPGPGGMLLLQNGVLFFALGMLFHAFGLSALGILALFLLFVVSPLLIGPMLVVWKDVGMSAFLLLSVALAVFYTRHRQSRYLVAAMIAAAIGGAYRLNAFPALLPLMLGIATLALLWRKSDQKIRVSAPSLVRILGLAAALSGAALAFFMLSVSFRLPDLKPLPRVFNAALYSQVFDLLGISACAERVLVPNELMLRPMSAADIKRLYDPRCVLHSVDTGNPAKLQETFGSMEEPFTFQQPEREHQIQILLDRIQHAWWDAIRAYPGCYLMHRLLLLRYLMGANDGDVYYLTHAEIQQNDLGIAMTPTPLTSMLLQLIIGDSPLARLWVFILTATLTMFWLYRKNRTSFWWAAMLMTSGLLYLIGNVFMLPSADARYQHWVAVCMFVIVALGIKKIEFIALKPIWAQLRRMAYSHAS